MSSEQRGSAGRAQGTGDKAARRSRAEAIASELRKEITGRRFAIGERFPPEPELRQRFGVGRHTVREALKLLAEQGLIGRRRKTGTFVLATSPVAPYVHALRDLKALLDFAEATDFRISHLGRVSASSKLLGDFAGTSDLRWTRIAGLRFVRGEPAPLCWTEIIVPERFSPARERLTAARKTIYEEVLAHNGLRLEYVEQEVTASLLPAAMLPLLQVEGDPAALLVKRRYVAHTGDTFEIAQSLYPASRYRLRSVIRQRA